mmetsp:Transcript_15475/g.17195  ORF Transcript_15475/g.17195 Transcript_15475/m.17195 type:complete len:80 (+) Transcript_15475:585-824(+)
MVEDSEETKKANRELEEKEYGIKNPDLKKRSLMYRLFRPNQADYNIQYPDRRVTDHPGNTYDGKVGGYPSSQEMHEHHW